MLLLRQKTSLARRIACARTQASSSSARSELDYLNTWLGNTSGGGAASKSQGGRAQRAAVAAVRQQQDAASTPRPAVRTSTAALMQGKTYLIPTVRIERGDTPDVLKEAMQPLIARSPEALQKLIDEWQLYCDDNLAET